MRVFSGDEGVRDNGVSVLKRSVSVISDLDVVVEVGVNDVFLDQTISFPFQESGEKQEGGT